MLPIVISLLSSERQASWPSDSRHRYSFLLGVVSCCLILHGGKQSHPSILVLSSERNSWQPASTAQYQAHVLGGGHKPASFTRYKECQANLPHFATPRPPAPQNARLPMATTHSAQARGTSLRIPHASLRTSHISAGRGLPSGLVVGQRAWTSLRAPHRLGIPICRLHRQTTPPRPPPWRSRAIWHLTSEGLAKRVRIRQTTYSLG